MLVQFIVENFWLLLAIFIMLHFRWLSLLALMIALVKAGVEPIAVLGILAGYLILCIYDHPSN